MPRPVSSSESFDASDAFLVLGNEMMETSYRGRFIKLKGVITLLVLSPTLIIADSPEVLSMAGLLYKNCILCHGLSC